MWISKGNYVALQRENAANAATLESKIGTIKRLEAEIVYWREKFESAQNRADRVSDLAFETSGFKPISDLGVSERERSNKTARDAADEIKRLTTELYAEEIGGEDDADDADANDAEGFGVEVELVKALTLAAKEVQR